jgi:hypothetical protein
MKTAMACSLLLCMDFRWRRDTRGVGGQGIAFDCAVRRRSLN